MDSDMMQLAVDRALAEDVGPGDLTTAATVSEGARAGALITQKAPGVIYGLEPAAATFRALDPGLAIRRLVEEGEWREGVPVLALEGSAMAARDEARAAGDRRNLLDNMARAQLADAARHVGGRASLKASGGVTVDTFREIAATGVQFVSVSALTHSSPALDLSLILEPIS